MRAISIFNHIDNINHVSNYDTQGNQTHQHVSNNGVATGHHPFELFENQMKSKISETYNFVININDKYTEFTYKLFKLDKEKQKIKC